MFFLGVSPEHTKADDAIASLYRVPAGLENEIKYIQRQGERFSTVFTETGKKKIKSMSEKDIQKTVTLGGSRYFSLMQYEY